MEHINGAKAGWLLMSRDAKIKHLMNLYDCSKETVLKGFDLRTGQVKLSIEISKEP